VSKQRYAVRDLVDALQGLQDLVNMPVSAMTDDMAFRLARAMRQVKPEVEVYERRRIALMRELGTVTAQDGKSEILDPAKQDEYEERLAALLDRELSLNLEPIPWAEAKAAIPGLRLGHLALCHVLFCHEPTAAAVAQAVEDLAGVLDEIASDPGAGG